MRRLMAQDIDALIEGILEYAVRITLHLDCLNELQRFRVPHGYGFTARESMAGLCVHRGAIGPDVRNLPRLGRECRDRRP